MVRFMDHICLCDRNEISVADASRLSGGYTEGVNASGTDKGAEQAGKAVLPSRIARYIWNIDRIFYHFKGFLIGCVYTAIMSIIIAGIDYLVLRFLM